MELPRKSVEDAFKHIINYGYGVGNDEVIARKLSLKNIRTCGQYLQLGALQDAIGDSLDHDEDWQKNIDNLIAYIDTLPNKADTPTKVTPQEKSNILLSQENIVHKAGTFYKNNNLTNEDLMKTIQEMLSTQQYTLCMSLQTTKLNFDEANKAFLSVIAPHKLPLDDLKALIFA
jgi:hypothetical protein